MKQILRKPIALLLACVFLLGLTAPALAADVTAFTDVTQEHWGYEEIADVVSRGLFVGVSETSFAPEMTMSRAMFVTVLSRLAGKISSNMDTPFSDVASNTWYSDAVLWAYEADIVMGVSADRFAPDEAVSREQIATLIVRYAEWAKISLPDEDKSQSIADIDSISDWAYESVLRCYQAGLINGRDSGSFDPQAEATRAEVAAIVSRLCALIDTAEEDSSSEAESGSDSQNLNDSSSSSSSGSSSDSGSSSSTGSTAVPSLSIASTIFGQADTGNKSTLKALLLKTSGPGDTNIYYYNEEGVRVAYEEGTEVDGDQVTYTGEAILTLEMDGLDNSKIDSGNAVVSLAPGDGYYVDELVLNATSLEGEWANGTLSYTLDVNDIEWYTGDYLLADFNSSREWSCFGGDGNGCYTFNLEVSGIIYNGQAVESQIFQVEVYIWGRSAADTVAAYNNTADPVAAASSSGVEQTETVVWTWIGAGDMPILCDAFTDDFFITWPTGTDASSLSAEDIRISIVGDYNEYELKSGEDYTIFYGETETQLAVTFRHWASTPVVQQGGGGVTIDGTVTAYSYYGFENLTDYRQVMSDATYTLSVATEDDGVKYYSEDEYGNGMLVDSKAEAMVFDGSGEDDRNLQLIVSTAMITTRVDATETKSIQEEIVTFTKQYSGGGTRNAAALAAQGLVAADGYVLGDAISPTAMWAWQDRFLCGWLPEYGVPTAFPNYYGA